MHYPKINCLKIIAFKAEHTQIACEWVYSLPPGASLTTLARASQLVLEGDWLIFWQFFDIFMLAFWLSQSERRLAQWRIYTCDCFDWLLCDFWVAVLEITELDGLKRFHKATSLLSILNDKE